LNNRVDAGSPSGIIYKPPVCPVAQTVLCSNPQTPIPCCEQRSNVGRWQLLPNRGSPRNETNTIETYQPSFGRNPQVAVGCLRHRGRSALKKSVLNPPCCVSVLGDVEAWINCQDRTCRRHQEKTKLNASQKQKLGCPALHSEDCSRVNEDLAHNALKPLDCWFARWPGCCLSVNESVDLAGRSSHSGELVEAAGQSSEPALRSDIGNSSRQHESDCGSSSASTRDIETAPNQIRSFTHACKTEVPSLMRKESLRF
jgi:hypothetical protein